MQTTTLPVSPHTHTQSNQPPLLENLQERENQLKNLKRLTFSSPRSTAFPWRLLPITCGRQTGSRAMKRLSFHFWTVHSRLSRTSWTVARTSPAGWARTVTGENQTREVLWTSTLSHLTLPLIAWWAVLPLPTHPPSWPNLPIISPRPPLWPHPPLWMILEWKMTVTCWVSS